MTPDLTSLTPCGAPRAIQDMDLSGALKVLVLAPHPDDFDAIGVTIRYLSRNGNPIHVGVARTGSGVDDAQGPGLTMAERADLREHEQRRSLSFFGLPEQRLTFLALANDADDRPVDSAENAAAIGAFVAGTAPDLVFLPHGNDPNVGHRLMASFLRRAARRSGHRFAAFLNRDPKTISMRTDVYTAFGQDEADWKAELLRFHDSQHQRNLRTRGHGFDARILEDNRKTACELSLTQPYAEAFEIVRHSEM
jgi:LmbE family N-acetylglucosaminyl deacetylase